MKERFSTLFSIGIMVVLVIGTWWAAEYAQNAVIIDPPPRITHERDNWSQNFVVLRTDEQGHVIHRLEGDNMDHFPDDLSYEVIIHNVSKLRLISSCLVCALLSLLH